MVSQALRLYTLAADKPTYHTYLPTYLHTCVDNKFWDAQATIAASTMKEKVTSGTRCLIIINLAFPP